MRTVRDCVCELLDLATHQTAEVASRRWAILEAARFMDHVAGISKKVQEDAPKRPFIVRFFWRWIGKKTRSYIIDKEIECSDLMQSYQEALMQLDALVQKEVRRNAN